MSKATKRRHEKNQKLEARKGSLLAGDSARDLSSKDRPASRKDRGRRGREDRGNSAGEHQVHDAEKPVSEGARPLPTCSKGKPSRPR